MPQLNYSMLGQSNLIAQPQLMVPSNMIGQSPLEGPGPGLDQNFLEHYQQEQLHQQQQQQQVDCHEWLLVWLPIAGGSMGTQLFSFFHFSAQQYAAYLSQTQAGFTYPPLSQHGYPSVNGVGSNEQQMLPLPMGSVQGLMVYLGWVLLI